MLHPPPRVGWIPKAWEVLNAQRRHPCIPREGASFDHGYAGGRAPPFSLAGFGPVARVTLYLNGINANPSHYSVEKNKIE